MRVSISAQEGEAHQLYSRQRGPRPGRVSQRHWGARRTAGQALHLLAGLLCAAEDVLGLAITVLDSLSDVVGVYELSWKVGEWSQRYLRA